MMFGRRRRGDEEAWRTWQWLTSPAARPAGRMVGRVDHVYQQARRGAKAVVDFGPGLGICDTWWQLALGRPRQGQWVLVVCHLWRPPGTHSGHEVWWVDAVEGVWPADLRTRAERHAKRVASGRRPRPPKPPLR